MPSVPRPFMAERGKISLFVKYIQGVPKKMVFLGKSPLTGLGRGLKIKVG